MLINIRHHREKLKKCGYCELSSKDIPWSEESLERLASIVDPRDIPYERHEYGDTGESNPVSFFRILHPKISGSNLPECSEMIINEKTSDYFQELTGIKNFIIDRVQTHRYDVGDYISVHVDSESCPEYVYSFMLLLSDTYEGGEFIMYPNCSTSVTIKPRKFSLIVAHSGIPHEVKTVSSGVRHSMVFFMRPT